jgi:hypothetical protein
MKKDLIKNVPQENQTFIIKTGLTIATARLLPNVMRCFKCHMIGPTH